MHRRYIEQKYQYELYTTVILYTIHKYNNTDTVIIQTNISIQTPL